MISLLFIIAYGVLLFYPFTFCLLNFCALVVHAKFTPQYILELSLGLFLNSKKLTNIPHVYFHDEMKK